MNRHLKIFILPAAAICLASCGQDLEDKETLATETYSYVNGIFGTKLKADTTSIASCYDAPDKVILMVKLLALPVEQSAYGPLGRTDAGLITIDRKKGQALLRAWLNRGIKLRDPLTMLFCADTNGNPAFDMMNMPPEEAERMEKDAFLLLQHKPDKNGEQWMALLLCHLHGRGTEANLAAAKEIHSFLEAEAAAGRIPPLRLPQRLVEELNRETP